MQFSAMKVILICLILTIFSTAQGQTNRKEPIASPGIMPTQQMQPPAYFTTSDSIYKEGIIEIKKSGGRTLYLVGDSIINEKALATVFAPYQVANSEYLLSQKLRKTTNGFICASILSLGVAGIRFLNHTKKSSGNGAKDDYNATFLYTGLACLGISIPLTLLHHIHLSKAISAYNLQREKRISEIQVQLKANPRAVAIQLSF